MATARLGLSGWTRGMATTATTLGGRTVGGMRGRLVPVSVSALRLQKHDLAAHRGLSSTPARGGASATSATEPYVKGTVNDAVTFPAPSKSHGSYHWDMERFLSIALVPLTAAALARGNHPAVDAILAGSLIVHSHIGFDSILIDYLHPRKFPKIGPVALWTLRLATVGTLVGFYQFQTQDIGLTELCYRLWHA